MAGNQDAQTGGSGNALRLASLVCYAAGWLASCVGCGTSVYNEKFQRRLAQLRITSPFADLRTPTADLPINFRIPLIFTEAYDRNSVHPLDQEGGKPKRIRPDRVAPPFLLDFPGLRVMYQGEQSDSGHTQTLPYYCYLGEDTAASVNGKFPYDAWLERIKRNLTITQPWKSIDVNTPIVNDAGQIRSLNWKRLVAKGKMEFDIVNFQTREFRELDGYFEMWVYETPQWIAVLGWRAPESIIDQLHFSELARLTAGTAVVNPEVRPPTDKRKAPGK